MIRVRARCSRCEEVELALKDFLLARIEGEKETYYSFICPLCGEVQAYPADQRFIDFMAMNNERTVVLKPPLECREAEGAPPLSWDDLLDFHLLLGEE